jgi:hypothetical protein
MPHYYCVRVLLNTLWSIMDMDGVSIEQPKVEKDNLAENDPTN